MNIFVCIKGVPDTAEAEIRVDATGKNVHLSDQTLDINDADNYALEESILIKEATGGSVQIVSTGASEDDDMITMEALAKGADSAILIDDPSFSKVKDDPLFVAKVLAAAIKGHEFDLVLTGCIAADDGFTAVGVALAEELGVPHAAMVKKVELAESRVRVHRELEGGISEVVDLSLPAVLTIQTGINKPRYSSVRSIRKAQQKELKSLKLKDIGFSAEEVENGSQVKLQQFYLPTLISQAEIIEGESEVKAEILADKLVKGGVL
jgi:electron transfer flavoprotein beta subunit